MGDAIEVAKSSNALPLPLTLPNQGPGAVNTATNGQGTPAVSST